MNMAKYLISQGHQVRVLLHQANQYGIEEFYSFEDVLVFPPKNGVPENLILWSDIILTHLEFTNWTLQVGRIFKRPIVYISHNTSFDAYQYLNDNPQAGIIYNSNSMKALSPFSNPSVVLHPAIDRGKIASKTGDCITLINCNENKGGKIFSRLAVAMPERKFLAVKGSYEKQFIPDLPNVRVVENSPDILPVYQSTRILLMLSRYESWGMTATEAMASGIPVIACPTFGLKENLSMASVFIPERGPIDEETDDELTYDIKPLIAAIKKLDKSAVYERHKQLGLARAAELAPEKELAECEEFLLNLVQSNI